MWFLWRWPFSPIYTWLENIYVYTNLWDGRVPMLMDLECSGTLGSLMFLYSFLVETCQKVTTASVVLCFSQFNRTGVIPQKLVTTRLADIKLVSKIFTSIVFPATTLKSLLVHFKRTQINPQAQGYRYSFHSGVYQGIVFIHRETMVKEVDSSPSNIY